ncbi:MAG: transcription-repair coupling factor [Spirochaetes bacterium]|nr:transcription-repair coupling factor [Spirochaetota bacterium]
MDVRPVSPPQARFSREILRHLSARPDFEFSLGAQWLSGLSGSALALVAAARFEKKGLGQFWIFPSEREAEHFVQDLESLHLGLPAVHFPDTGIFPYEDLAPAGPIQKRRVTALERLAGGEKILLAVSLRALLRRTVTAERFARFREAWTATSAPGYRDILHVLAELHYTQVSEVEEVGEYAIRGELIDFWSPAHPHPVRLSFFDQAVEDLRFFDGETQRTIAKTPLVKVLPLSEWHLGLDEVPGLEKALGERKDLDDPGLVAGKLRDSTHFGGIQNYLPFLFEKIAPLWSWIPPEAEVFPVNPELLSKTCEIHHREVEEARRRLTHRRRAIVEPAALFAEWKDFPPQRARIPIYPVRTEEGGEGASFTLPEPANYRAQIKEFQEESASRIAGGWRIFLLTAYPEQADRLAGLFADLKPRRMPREKAEALDVASAGLAILEVPLQNGFVLAEAKLAVVMDHELFGRKRRTHRNFLKDDPTRILESYLDLKVGDPVVHLNHGIGLYRGLHRRAIDGKEKDYLKIEYQENAALYLPVEQVNLIQKYVGAQGKAAIDTLGGKAWDKVKARVKKAVADIARSLIHLYSQRRSATKTPFPPDTPWQYEFESAFEFEETPDQLRAIEAIKRDMESTRPMDRLVCGDVGFGKTEVAMRAVFKAALGSRQTAVLVPTTILSEQHLQNFRERFRQYPVRIEAVNRFHTPTEVRRILKDTAAGKVDVLIGTHRLLSKDVAFRDLGLLVVDEEQKFGVKHKERIRERAAMVDTLTLSATPIPRTLHMSMIQVRDISVINTPPADRHPVETYVTELNEEILLHALEREIGRGGQVYFVHNRVQSIASVAAWLQDLMPSLRIVVGHGQMEEHVLEEVMDRFIRHEADLLLCTTIIDSGLDIHNANTLFINHVEDFGLSQLYQLRGRVGRSARQAWAYFFYRKDRSLTEQAQKRLAAVSEFVELGSGIKIAMRDLELRGAGNVLGAEQSGDVMAVGFELYCQLLDEAVHELLADGVVRAPDAVIDLKYHGYIPDEYIPDPRNKIEVYKQIGGIRSEGEIADVVAAIEDRYGKMPALISKLVALSRLRVMATEMRVVSVLEKPGRLEIEFSPESRIRSEQIPALLRQGAGRMRILPDRPRLLLVDLANQSKEDSENLPFEGKIDLVTGILTSFCMTGAAPPASVAQHALGGRRG